MGINRRGFLKVSGLTAVGLASGSVSKVFASDTEPVDSLADTLLGAEPTTSSGPLKAVDMPSVMDGRPGSACAAVDSRTASAVRDRMLRIRVTPIFPSVKDHQCE